MSIKNILSMSLVVAIISGCATTLMQQATYTPPDVSTVGNYSETIDKNFDQTWTAVIDFVSTSSFAIDNFEKDSGLITLSFGTSSPSRYIDCGMFSSTGRLIFSGSYVDYINGPSLWGSSLSGQMNISIRSLSEGNTNVRVNARYIWTAGTNPQLPYNRMIYTFDTGGSATNYTPNPTSGTIPTRTCVPTYDAESSVIYFIKSL